MIEIRNFGFVFLLIAIRNIEFRLLFHALKTEIIKFFYVDIVYMIQDQTCCYELKHVIL